MKTYLLSLMLFIGVLGSAALAQVGAPVPEPSPTPPPTFQSPFNGERQLSDPEGKDYTSLQQLYDFWQDDLAAVKALKSCPDSDPLDIKHAEELAANAEKAFQSALDQYVVDWSNNLYRKGYRPDPGVENPGFSKDRDKVLEMLQKNYKPFLRKAGCPDSTKPIKEGPIPPKPDRPRKSDGDNTGLPPCDDGDKVAARIEDDETELSEVVGHERTASGDALVSLHGQEGALREELAGLNGLKACPSAPPENADDGPHVTIGIGIGVGGDDHQHRDHDDHHDDRDHHEH